CINYRSKFCFPATISREELVSNSQGVRRGHPRQGAPKRSDGGPRARMAQLGLIGLSRTQNCSISISFRCDQIAPPEQRGKWDDTEVVPPKSIFSSGAAP